MTAQSQELEFQAETKQLLDLMIHSLYTSKDIFLRELISNASDAIDRLRFESLTDPEMLQDGSEFEIRLDPDGQARTLTISDNGIGMSRDELIANIGTIAKSGTRELREKIRAGESPQALAEFIGQFGVGFYSCFMVSDKVALVTKRAGEDTATRWESTGDGRYTLRDDARPTRGTSITLHLKPVDSEAGIEDYADYWVLSRIVRRYSDFVSYPIHCKDQREELEKDEHGIAKKDAKPTIVVEDKILNSMKPIWTRTQAETTKAEYDEFYRHISHDWTEPFKVLTLKAEGTVEYEALLFIPAKAPHDLFYHAAECGLRLYAKRVMIMERSEDLLPRYLRFIKGVVDSSDLPLNISRQMLQQDRHITQIRKWVTKKVLDTLTDLKEQEYDKYLEFWEQFGRCLKEGASSDYDNKDKILSLLLFESSNDPEKLTTLKDYLSRMKKPLQNEIYYLTGETRAIVENSPHLEAFKAKDYEVLYLTDPVDELLVQSLMDFEGKRLKSVGKGTVLLGTEDERKKAEEGLKEKEKEAADLLEFIQKHLDKDVKQVRLSTRLVASPVCLVGTEIDYSPQMERLLQMGKGAGPKQRRIMELNPNHDIFTKMLARYKTNQQDDSLGDSAELLLGYGLLAEGSELPDAARFNKLIADALVRIL
ncbi:MAG TPA: molecular chaperone HtpG [Blastocatellia bacterium]|nr:molecular chaperone HtpG [Blastocatellia bacterium]